MSAYNKTIAAFLGGLVTLMAPWVPGLTDVVTPGVIDAIGVLLTAFLVWAVPNKVA